MDLIFYNLANTKNHISYSILNVDEIEIGSVEGWVNDEGGLTSVVMVNQDYQGNKIGFDSFIKVFEELNSKITIKYFRASWNSGDEYSCFENGISTNLLIFQKCMESKNKNSCVFETPTGKWMKKIGFNNFEINFSSRDQVEVTFFPDSI